ncbi:hypothetical protein C4572_01255 [Candidatus Parcubacteria bacterium]|nr:MAG: hypothetical protein C4572_01255 [Candidatus Parcubacteria bacterium]
MLNTQNYKDIRDFDENARRLKEQALRDAEGAKKKLELQEQRRKQLKLNDRKTELEEIKSKIALKQRNLTGKENDLNLLKGEQLSVNKELEKLEETVPSDKSLNSGNAGKWNQASQAAEINRLTQHIDQEKGWIAREKEQTNKERLAEETKYAAEKKKIEEIAFRVAGKTAEIKRIEQEISTLNQEVARHEKEIQEIETRLNRGNTANARISQKENDLARDAAAKEKIKKELEKDQKQEKEEQKKNEAMKARLQSQINAKRTEMIHLAGRTSNLEKEIEKEKREFSLLQSQMQKIEQEIRSLIT